MRLAGQLQQQGPLNPDTLAQFILKHELTPEEVAVLQSEMVTNLVTLFSVQQTSTSLTQAVRRATPIITQSIPTLADLSKELREQALFARKVFLPGDVNSLQAVLNKADEFGTHSNPFRTIESMGATTYSYDRLYPFPYDPMAAGRVKNGSMVRYYYPGEGLDLTAVDQVALVDDQTGVVQLSSSKMIPLSFVTGIVGTV